MAKLICYLTFLFIGSKSAGDAVKEFREKLYFRAGVDTMIVILSVAEILAIRFHS